MEQQILTILDQEVTRRVALGMALGLEVISKNYDIPLERLIKDTAGLDKTFCMGILKSHKRCLKNPQPNGYCKFHQCQVPPPAPKATERVKAPWE
jgi:hypothetical protein